jgi:hypothetical protein
MDARIHRYHVNWDMKMVRQRVDDGINFVEQSLKICADLAFD